MNKPAAKRRMMQKRQMIQKRRMIQKGNTMEGSSKKIVTYFSALTPGHKEKISSAAEKNGFSVVFCGSKEEAAAEITDAEIYLGMDSDLISKGSALKWVCSPSAGVGHLMGVLKGRDIMLTNSSGAYGVTIAEHIIMVTLELMRRRMEYIELIRNRTWENGLAIHSIQGARITMLGTGDIGYETAVRLKAFGPKSLIGVNRRGNNPNDMYDSICPISKLDSILPQTDLLICSLPSTDETRDLLTAARLSLLPTDAYIVNVGRGDVLDQKALENMLREGKLGGAALDVFREEPIPADDSLWDCPGLVITMHSAGTWTLPYTVGRIVDMFLTDLDLYCAGRKPERFVDLSVGY